MRLSTVAFFIFPANLSMKYRLAGEFLQRDIWKYRRHED